MASKEKSHIGYIAYIDILGFSQESTLRRFQNHFDEYYKCVQESIEPPLEFILSSDNIIIYSDSVNAKCFKNIIRSCAYLFSNLLNIQIAPRGCISQGQYSILETEKNNVVIVGPSLVDAVHYEQEQNWIGIMISPLVWKKQMEKRQRTLNCSKPKLAIY